MLVSNQGEERGGTLGWVHITQDLKLQSCFWQILPCHWYPVWKYVISKYSWEFLKLAHYILLSLQGNLRLRPRCVDWAKVRSIHQAEVWDFSVMTEQTGVISYLLYGLFFMDLKQQKTNNWLADNFQNELYTWAHDTVSRCSFWQLSIVHNMDIQKDV